MDSARSSISHLRAPAASEAVGPCRSSDEHELVHDCVVIIDYLAVEVLTVRWQGSFGMRTLSPNTS